jgi:hypothetical protein
MTGSNFSIVPYGITFGSAPPNNSLVAFNIDPTGNVSIPSLISKSITINGNYVVTQDNLNNYTRLDGATFTGTNFYTSSNNFTSTSTLIYKNSEVATTQNLTSYASLSGATFTNAIFGTIANFTTVKNNNLDVATKQDLTSYANLSGATFSGTISTTNSGINIQNTSINTTINTTGNDMLIVGGSSGSITIRPDKGSSTQDLKVTTSGVTCTTLSQTSDYRIKSNVTDLDETNIVSNLRPVKYYNNLTNKEDYGFIAHEIQEIYPSVVNGEKDGENLQSMNYISLIPLLINEIKLLKKEITELKNKIE